MELLVALTSHRHPPNPNIGALLLLPSLIYRHIRATHTTTDSATTATRQSELDPQTGDHTPALSHDGRAEAFLNFITYKYL
jgi:hypothetical protein